jgi:ATP-binding cassette subfamily B protein
MSEPVSKWRAAAAMVRIAWTADPRRSLSVVGLSVLQALAQSLFALWLKLLLDGVQSHNERTLDIAVIGIGLSILIGSGLSYVVAQVRAGLTDRAHHLVERRLVALVGGTPTLEIHETPEHLTQLEVLLGREGWEFGQVIPSLMNLLTLIVRALSAGLLLVGVDPVLLVLPLFGLPALLLSGKTGSIVGTAHDRAAEPTRLRAYLYELATGDAAAAKEIRLFRLRDTLLRRFSVAQREMQQIRRKVGIQGALIGLAGRLVFLLGYFGAIVFVVRRAIAGDASVGDAVLTAVLAGQVLSLVTGSAEVLTWAWRTLTAAGRFVYIERLAGRAAPHVDNSAELPARLSTGIQLDHVSYRYPGLADDALHDVNLLLPAGSTVAIVGDNGAGKSTLVKLLAGLYLPTSGRITVDGVDLQTLDPVRWRQRITAGFQDYARFEVLAREAIGIGDLPEMDDEAAIRSALERAGAVDVLRSLPEELDTQLGTSWPDGVDLSGGQWQKLALARAMMRTTPLLLLLDEPTAALDADTEHRLFERWATAASDLRESTGTVTILVSHRFSTVRMADLIVVINDGQIVEIGNHNQLIRRNGQYAELFETQARAYR